ncbi:telomeric repeat binding factor a isoform X2 [Conger conger]|uniref:telomeric repeat binding factor a isoform X2 n=1 Tax=Conger conger TaxID=82655 RepID=UPI002A5A8CCC|nr:telomeric repeat binding factor a isoform X2 [Conger conger]
MGDISLGSSKMSSDVDCTINGWCVDYYTFTAVNAFRNGDYGDFCKIRDVLQSLVARPLEHSEILRKQIRVMQFLSRINDGDKLDLTFDSQDACTPLESALTLLLSISEELDVSQTVVERVQLSICETLAIIYKKNKNYLKAEEVVKKHLPDSMGQEKQNLLQLVRSKSDAHPVVQRFSYDKFRKSMLDFCESLYTSPEPLLCKMVKELAGRKQLDEGKTSKLPTSPAQAHTGPMSPGSVQLKRSLLKAAFESLREEQQVHASFQQLEHEVQQEVQWENALWDAEGGAAGGGGPGAQPCTIAQLVMEEDSELDPAVSQEEPTAQPVEPVDLSANLRAVPLDVATRPENLRAVPLDVATRPENLRAAPLDVAIRPEEPGPGLEKASSSEESLLSAMSSPVLPYRKPRSRPANGATRRYTIESDDSDSPVTPEHIPPADRQRTSPYPVRTSPYPNRTSRDPTRTSPYPNRTSRDPTRTSTTNGKLQKRRVLDSPTEIKEDWSDEDSLFAGTRGTNRIKKSREQRKFWTAEESEWVRQGVAKFGEGNWTKIRAQFPFKGRTAVNIKDKWRTMKKVMCA